MLSNIMSSVLMLNIVMVNVMAPLEIKEIHKKINSLLKLTNLNGAPGKTY
jgi:hypothetical protein